MRRISVLIAVALLVAACGGGGQKTQPASGATATTTTRGAPTTTAPAVNLATDKARARALLLTLADFPTGWKATPYKADPAEKKSDEEFAACLGIPNPASHTTANIDSPDFSMGDAGASSGAEIVRTVEDFKADTAALDSVKFLPCVKAQLATMLAREIQGASQQSLAVEPLKVAKYGEFSKGIRATSRFKIQGQPVSLYFDVVFLGKERSELTAAFFNVGKPFDPALERALLDRLGARLEAA